MKKISILALALTCVIALVGCHIGTDKEPLIETTVSYAGWSDDSSIISGALNEDELKSNGKGIHCPIFRIDTKRDLEKFKAEYGDIFTMYRGYGDLVPSFDDAISKAQFDRSSFFQDNSLLIVYVISSSGSLRFGVSDVDYDSESLRVYVKQTNDPELVTADKAGWFVIVAIPDSEIRTCKSFDAICEDDRY